MNNRTVQLSTTLRQVDRTGGVSEMSVEFGYDASDPFAIHAVFRSGTGTVHWEFSRDLLAAGLIGPSGEGDVRLRPCHDDEPHVLILLSPPSRTAEFSAPLGALADFLDRTSELVPVGDESRWIDFDTEIARLMEIID
ncbi:hypothetical protein UK23_31035 [Lentzea aerocolonigenes]|uniref:Sporulation protein SsgA n=2 Tax=Lentzea aerocolonigenes TaxID=68170 RepID=A0A0F0GPY1_LENAE|nr:hypothetical protein UK23_31035 [Lentzea aerocolonigenes]